MQERERDKKETGEKDRESGTRKRQRRERNIDEKETEMGKRQRQRQESDRDDKDRERREKERDEKGTKVMRGYEIETGERERVASTISQMNICPI